MLLKRGYIENLIEKTYSAMVKLTNGNINVPNVHVQLRKEKQNRCHDKEPRNNETNVSWFVVCAISLANPFQSMACRSGENLYKLVFAKGI